MLARGRAPRLLGPLSCALLATSGIVGALVTGRNAGAITVPANVDTPGDVRTVYLRDCAVCHGADARGTVDGPSLQGVGRASVDYWVSTGRMPLLRNTRSAKSPED